MSMIQHDMIERLKLKAIRRCEERIEQAAREKGERKEYQPPQFGVSSLLKHKHGL
jgi:hypothetical protein